MIGMGDRGILIFVSEPLLTFFPETKSGCFLSLRVNIRIVNDRMCFFNYVIPYTDPFGRYKEMIQNVFLGQFVCVCEIGSYDLQINVTSPAICLWCAYGPGGFSSVV